MESQGLGFGDESTAPEVETSQDQQVQSQENPARDTPGM